MAFTANDFHDLVRLLAEHPEWRADLRRLVLSEELLALPDLIRDLAHEVRELAAAQQRAEERLAALGEVQRRAEERLARVEEGQVRLEARQDRLEEGQARLEAALAALAEAQRRTEEQVAALVEAQRRHEAEFAAFQVRAEERFGDLTGWVLVERFRNRAPAYLRAVVRRARVLLSHEVAQFVEDAEERGVLNPAEADDVLEADAVIARARARGGRGIGGGGSARCAAGVAAGPGLGQAPSCGAPRVGEDRDQRRIRGGGGAGGRRRPRWQPAG